MVLTRPGRMTAAFCATMTLPACEDLTRELVFADEIEDRIAHYEEKFETEMQARRDSNSVLFADAQGRALAARTATADLAPTDPADLPETGAVSYTGMAGIGPDANPTYESVQYLADLRMTAMFGTGEVAATFTNITEDGVVTNASRLRERGGKVMGNQVVMPMGGVFGSYHGGTRDETPVPQRFRGRMAGTILGADAGAISGVIEGEVTDYDRPAKGQTPRTWHGLFDVTAEPGE